MAILVSGLVLFLGMHLLPTVPRLRATWMSRLGEQGYKGLFSIVSLAGLILIVVGYRMADASERLFAPLPGAAVVAPWAMTLALILFASSHMRAHLRQAVQHPMVLGLLIWSGVHLLANGDVRGTVLFGGFLGYSVIDLLSAVRRDATKSFVPTVKHDVIAIVAGTIVALVIMAFHRVLFGHAVVPFGV